MVLASILVFLGVRRDCHCGHESAAAASGYLFHDTAAAIFVSMLFLDYFLGSIQPALAVIYSQSGGGHRLDLPDGMGYTFYLPFALYVAGLLCWCYTVIKLLTHGTTGGLRTRTHVYGRLCASCPDLTLMVVLGVMLLTMDRRRRSWPPMRRSGPACYGTRDS